MRPWLIASSLLLFALPALALDVCPSYRAIHDRQITTRIRSGVPFRLLSVAQGNKIYKRIVRIEFDLWTEMVTVELADGKDVVTPLKDAFTAICQNISFPELATGENISYHLLLNPILGNGLKRLHDESKAEGYLRVNWENLERELQSEQTLISIESIK